MPGYKGSLPSPLVTVEFPKTANGLGGEYVVLFNTLICFCKFPPAVLFVILSAAPLTASSAVLVMSVFLRIAGSQWGVPQNDSKQTDKPKSMGLSLLAC